jgi:hypothetical protein
MRPRLVLLPFVAFAALTLQAIAAPDEDLLGKAELSDR